MRTLLLLTVLVAGCANAPDVARPNREPKYRIDVIDDVALRKFRLALVSDEALPICVTLDGWPNKGGDVVGGSQRMWLDIPGQERIAGKSFRFEPNCPGGCGYHVVKPGRVLKGFIGYEQFDRAEQWTSLPNKRLHFGATVEWCPSKK